MNFYDKRNICKVFSNITRTYTDRKSLRKTRYRIPFWSLSFDSLSKIYFVIWVSSVPVARDANNYVEEFIIQMSTQLFALTISHNRRWNAVKNLSVSAGSVLLCKLKARDTIRHSLGCFHLWRCQRGDNFF